MELPPLQANRRNHGDFAENSWPISLQRLQPNDARVLEALAVACPNPDCRKLTLTLTMFAAYRNGYSVSKSYPLRALRLEPSVPEPLPLRVPEQIRKDYEEAWLIKDTSPKAAATLARRALQGMIRDFWKIKERNLNDEINALRSRAVDPHTLEAIDGARRIGNLAAHMERDTSSIVEVEPAEAEALIWLIRELAEEWYLRYHERDKRMGELKKIAEDKTGTSKT
jgi:hypothetical protein